MQQPQKTKLLHVFKLLISMAAILLCAILFWPKAGIELKRGLGSEQVQKYCSPCHALTTVTSHKRSKVEWERVIIWMSTMHGMPAIPADERTLIINYLNQNYTK